MIIRSDRCPGRRSRLRRFLLVTSLFVVGTVVVEALDVPGNDSVAAKLAEWGRGHGLNGVITGLEQVTYRQPPTGGLPVGGIPHPDGALRPSSSAHGPAPLAALAPGQPLPNEGQWQTVVTSGGRPAVQVASLRPEDQHTSFVVGVMRLDPALVRGELHPGTQDPGGTWQASTSLSGPAQNGIAAVFNGGFRLSDPSHNGYYSEGRTVTPLRDGAASLVLRTDGTADVGAWNSEVRMGPDVASVRQNLQLLVDGGQVNPTCSTGGTSEWGSTIGQTAYIDRSGFGVTATGAEICTLGWILQDAGVVRDMDLDTPPGSVAPTSTTTRTAHRPGIGCTPPRRSPRRT
ncbi:MAG: hypothetical protein JWR58_2170, partial [Pseudonocardia sp.]|nr:hypothetical protein [Pseudonocardia sp.]